MDLATKVRMVQGQHLGTAHLLGQVVHFHVEAGISGSFPYASRDQCLSQGCKKLPDPWKPHQVIRKSGSVPEGWICP